MKYFRYKIKNIEPLRIADDSTSQSGQINSLRYIPGTTIRGWIVNSILQSDGNIFEQYKKVLLSEKVRFMNAYLYENDKELIPSPKGFYEDKTTSEDKKEIQNVVVEGEIDGAKKRASLGSFCYFQEDCIYYYNIETASDMKINTKMGNDDKINSQGVFRSEHICPGNVFVGYIAVEEEDIECIIKDAFKKDMILGNARNQGMGKCVLQECDFVSADESPYSQYAVNSDAKDYVYMMLLSNTVMRNEFGEYTGLDNEVLAELLGVESVVIEKCSTSTVNVKGYNRNWGLKIPSVNMYEKGSVFKLKFDGVASLQNLKIIMAKGMGVRKNEGFGQVIFLKDYEKIKYKKEGIRSVSTDSLVAEKSQDESVLKTIAAKYYRSLIVKAMQQSIISGTEEMNVQKSQVGNVRAQLEKNMYNPIEGIKAVKAYFTHKDEKDKSTNRQKNVADISKFVNEINNIFDQPLNITLNINKREVMGFDTESLISEEEEAKFKFEYILQLMKYENRGGR